MIALMTILIQSNHQIRPKEVLPRLNHLVNGSPPHHYHELWRSKNLLIWTPACCNALSVYGFQCVLHPVIPKKKKQSLMNFELTYWKITKHHSYWCEDCLNPDYGAKTGWNILIFQLEDVCHNQHSPMKTGRTDKNPHHHLCVTQKAYQFLFQVAYLGWIFNSVCPEFLHLVHQLQKRVMPIWSIPLILIRPKEMIILWERLKKWLRSWGGAVSS